MSAARALAAAAFASLLAIADPAVSDGASDAAQGQAQDAFEAGDYTRAEALWSGAAARGDPRGDFGLGLLADGGYGVRRDAPGAFASYLRAAEAGLPEAQFNVAVMLDVGLGTSPDARAAMTWYTRAALRGNARADYNLGLMVEAGLYGPADPIRAAHWFRRAARTLPAAATRLSPDDGFGTRREPELLFAAREGGMLELAWTASASGDSPFRIETLAVSRTGSYGHDRSGMETNITGLLVSDPASGLPLAVRVIAEDVSAREYLASAWAFDGAPDGRVAFALSNPIPQMQRFAETVASDLRDSGLWTRVGTAPEDCASDGAPTTSEVVYAWHPDAALAIDVAGLMPVLSERDARFDPDVDLQPGEVCVRLSAAD